MPVKTYGIFLAYAPLTKLQHQGLGRYLAYFLKAAAKRNDVRFLVACPSWTLDDLVKLCEAENVDQSTFDIIAPPGKPLLLSFYAWYLKYAARRRHVGRFATWKRKFLLGCRQHRFAIERRLATSRSIAGLSVVVAYVAMLALLLLPVLLILIVVRAARLAGSHFHRRLAEREMIPAIVARLRSLLIQPKDEPLTLRLYRFMEEHETTALVSMINARSHVKAWYSPAAFWPSFNDIKAPRIMCVPDVVLGDFPVGFSRVGGQRFLESFQLVEKAIRGGTNFTAYSNWIKWNTLVDRYAVDPSLVDVVPHAANDFRTLVNVTGFGDNETTSRGYAEALLSMALQKATNIAYAGTFANRSFRFLFFPSQFRPSKNVLNLLQAYRYLLKQRYIGHKLILTGNPQDMPEIDSFITDHNLANDVLCLHGLTVPELAACYKLAELAVNPSLSEGGCPFTFCEALSVGTPVVMAKIPVTEEVITDPHLQSMMLFDPYSWRDIADRIEWALRNRSQLISAQLITFESISTRTWDDVVADHINILDRVSGASTEISTCAS